MMTTRTLILLLVLLTVPNVGVPQSDGILAEYSVTSVAPAESVTHTFFLQVMVTPDRWLLQATGYSPHWTTPRVYPYPVDARFQCGSKNSLLLDRQSLGQKPIAHEELPKWVNMEQRGFDVLYFAHSRFGIWRPSTKDSTWTVPAEGANPIVGKYEVVFPLQASVQTRFARQRSDSVQLEQRLTGRFQNLWLSRNFEFNEALKKEGLPKWLPVRGSIFSTNGRFLRLDGEFQKAEAIAIDSPYTADEVAGIVLLSPTGKGGRWVELEWTSCEGKAIPKSITVTLGVEKGGMFLRQCRLVSARRLESGEFDRFADDQLTRTFDDDLAILIDEATQLCWGKDHRHASPETREKIESVRRKLSKLAEMTQCHGHRVMARQHLALLSLATENADSATLKMALEAHLEDLESSAGIRGFLASSFDLQSAVLEWKRPDLLPVIWRLCKNKLSKYPVDEQTMALIGAIHGLESDDLHASLLLDAASKAGAGFSDARLIRAAILRINGLLNRHNLNAQPQGRLFSESVLVPEQFSKFLKECASARDPMLSAVSESLLKTRSNTQLKP
jgi:hypothetical protein